MPSTLGIVASHSSSTHLPTQALLYHDTNDVSYTGGTNLSNLVSGGASLPGTVIGSPVYTSGPSNKYLTYNTTSYIHTSNINSYFLEDRPSFSIEIWAYPTSANGVIAASTSSTIPNTQYQCSIIELVNSRPFFRLYDVTPFPSSPTAISLNTWTHFTLTYDKNVLRGYVNGTLVATSVSFNWYTPKDNGKNDFRILVGAPSGTNMGSGVRFQGRFGAVKVYQATINSSQINSSYNDLRSRYGV
jgi:hypothetical protein